MKPADQKTGKEIVHAEVRRHRISLSNDSQGRDLSLIPPGFDGHSMLKSLPQQITLPQIQSTEEAWHRAGPEFRQGQTRFRTYGNTFDAGVVLPDYTGPRPSVAFMHTTTNLNKPSDISVDDKNNIPLRTVAYATTYRFGDTRFRRNPTRSFRTKRVEVFPPPEGLPSWVTTTEMTGRSNQDWGSNMNGGLT